MVEQVGELFNTWIWDFGHDAKGKKVLKQSQKILTPTWWWCKMVMNPMVQSRKKNLPPPKNTKSKEYFLRNTCALEIGIAPASSWCFLVVSTYRDGGLENFRGFSIVDRFQQKRCSSQNLPKRSDLEDE